MGIKEYRRKRTNQLIKKGLCPSHISETLPCSQCKRNLKLRFLENNSRNLCGMCGKRPLIPTTRYCRICSTRNKTYRWPEESRKAALIAVGNFKERCDACGRKDSGYCRDWNLDHDHKTMKFRGILCMGCNAALGQVKDSIKTLNCLIKYLKRAK